MPQKQTRLNKIKYITKHILTEAPYTDFLWSIWAKPLESQKKVKAKWNMWPLLWVWWHLDLHSHSFIWENHSLLRSCRPGSEIPLLLGATSLGLVAPLAYRVAVWHSTENQRSKTVGWPLMTAGTPVIHCWPSRTRTRVEWVNAWMDGGTKTA